jgi:large subunit ribosomal protein L9e
MRLVHAHFPINVAIPKDGKSIEVKNFLGGKEVKKIVLLPGTTVKLNPDLKDELIFEGIDNQNVSLSFRKHLYQYFGSCGICNKVCTHVE